MLGSARENHGNLDTGWRVHWLLCVGESFLLFLSSSSVLERMTGERMTGIGMHAWETWDKVRTCMGMGGDVRWVEAWDY
jgi:hypothetical protein